MPLIGTLFACRPPDLAPTLADKRTMGARDIAALWVSLVVSTTTLMLAGSLVDMGMSWVQVRRVVATIIWQTMVVIMMNMFDESGGAGCMVWLHRVWEAVARRMGLVARSSSNEPRDADKPENRRRDLSCTAERWETRIVKCSAENASHVTRRNVGPRQEEVTVSHGLMREGAHP